MPTVTNYTTLKQAILDFTHKNNITAYLDYYIQAAQEKINDDIFANNMGNGIRPMEAPFNGTIASGTIGVPSDWLAPKLLQVVNGSGQPAPLSFVSAQYLYDRYPDRIASNQPAYIARDGNTFVFGPYPDQNYNVIGTYYAAAALLSGSTATNWMVLQTPTLLLAACLIKAARFLRDPDGIALWKDEYAEKLQSLILRDKSERWGTGTLAIQTA